MTISVENCSRCGGDHDVVELSKLSMPFAPPECAPIAWTHWAPCPVNGQPIMVMIAAAAEIEPGRVVPSGTGQFNAALPIVYQVFLERRTAIARAAVVGSNIDDEWLAFESTVREFFGKWKPPTSDAPKP